MQEQDFPALYRSADDLSRTAQKNFLRALKLHLILLISAAGLSIIVIPHWSIAALQLFTLLGALACSIYLFNKRPDRLWYAGRAVAESVKTLTWRYVCKAEPFHSDDAIARNNFREKLKAVVEQNKEVVRSLTSHLEAHQITDIMLTMRACPLEERKIAYSTSRIANQLSWYANKAALNRRASNLFFWTLIVVNAFAVICATLRIKFIDVPYWPTDVLIAVAASLLSWMQARRFSELAASYALTAHEISLIREQSLLPYTDDEFSLFVGDAENAFSREHTQWIARKDV